MPPANPSPANGLPATGGPAMPTPGSAPSAPLQPAGSVPGTLAPATLGATPQGAGEPDAVGPSPDPCRRCGSARPPTATGQCPECQSFRKGNPSRTDHGLSPRCGRAAMPIAPADVARIVDLREQVLSDLGGASEVSAVLGALVEDFGRAVLLRDLAFRNIVEAGPLTAGGRKRSVVDIYLAASARVERLANIIGVQRRAKSVDPLDQVRRAVEEANRT